MSGLRPLAFEVLRELSLDVAPGFLSAASALVRVGERLHVASDDRDGIGSFHRHGLAPGCFASVMPDEVPDDAAQRKAAKADLEVLVRLPPRPGLPHGALLALGSGSRPQRCRGVLLPLQADGQLQPPFTLLDLMPLYAPLARRLGALNIEGALRLPGQLALLQRATGAGSANALAQFDSRAFDAWLAGQAEAPSADAVVAFELGSFEGVPLGFTDASALPDGAWVFTAAAEDTGNSYDDGPCRGSVVGRVSASSQLGPLYAVPGHKIEGVEASPSAAGVELLMVTDADDPARPALLLRATLPAA